MNRLPAALNEHLCKVAIVKRYNQGQTVFRRGDNNDFVYFLVEGSVSLQPAALSAEMLKANTGRTRFALDNEKPHAVTAQALTDCKLMRLPRAVFNNLDKTLQLIEQRNQSSIELRDDETENAIYRNFYDALLSQELALPSIPDLALRISRVVDDTNSTSTDIATVIQLDPGLTTRLINAANSPAFAGRARTHSCHDAVTRLGRNTTRRLAMSFILKGVFRTPHKKLNHYLHNLWIHSTQVAAISYILARQTPGLDADNAMLCGIVHDIGTIPVVSAAAQFPELLQHDELLERAINSLKAEIGVMTLREWDFEDAFVQVAENAENWLYEHDSAVNYVDIILVAQLHAFIGSRKMRKLPTLDLVPAFHRVAGGNLNPQQSFSIIDQARDDIHAIAQVLRG